MPGDQEVHLRRPAGVREAEKQEAGDDRKNRDDVDRTGRGQTAQWWREGKGREGKGRRAEVDTGTCIVWRGKARYQISAGCVPAKGEGLTETIHVEGTSHRDTNDCRSCAAMMMMSLNQERPRSCVLAQMTAVGVGEPVNVDDDDDEDEDDADADATELTRTATTMRM